MKKLTPEVAGSNMKKVTPVPAVEEDDDSDGSDVEPLDGTEMMNREVAQVNPNLDPLQEPKDDGASQPEVLKGYPAPHPPPNKKRAIINTPECKDADRKARLVDVKEAGSFEDLVAKLTKGIERDVVKVRAIYTWICVQKVTHSSYLDAPVNSPMGVLAKIKQQRTSLATLFALMCRTAKIPCVVITGIAKSASYELGEKNTDHLQNSWNAVYVSNGWRIVFPLWACRIAPYLTSRDEEKGEVSAQEGTINDYYFLTDPEEFIYRCFPEDPKWQLIRTPITKDKFLDLPFCRPPFFEHHLKMVSKNKCVFRSKNGMAEISIRNQENEDVVLSYELTYMDKENPLPSNIELNKYIAVINQRPKTNLKVRFPQTGTYQLDVIGGIARRTPQWLCTFKLVCTATKQHPRPYPLTPRIGFGPCVTTQFFEMSTRTQSAILLIHSKKELDIKFKLSRNLHVHTNLNSLEMSSESLFPYVKHKILGNELNINVGVPHNGEYVLQIHARDTYSESYENVCNYLLTSEDTKREKLRSYQTGAEKRAKIILHESLHSKDPEEIKKAVAKFQQYDLDDGGDLKKAHDKLEYIRISKALRNGILRRNMEVLSEALAEAKASEFSEKLTNVIEEAEEVKSEISNLKRFAHDILELSQKTVSEIHRYKTPSETMYNIMKATFLLLGEQSSSLKDWDEMTALMRQGGQKRLLNRIRKFDTVKLSMESGKEVAAILKKYTEDSVKASSAGVGTFYVWCHNIASHYGLVTPPPTVKSETVMDDDNDDDDVVNEEIKKVDDNAGYDDDDDDDDGY